MTYLISSADQYWQGTSDRVFFRRRVFSDDMGESNDFIQSADEILAGQRCDKSSQMRCAASMAYQLCT
jgi:hypothetical protein